jgi:hypothetical protein
MIGASRQFALASCTRPWLVGWMSAGAIVKPRIAIDAARQIDFGLNRIAVRGTVRHLPLVSVDDAGHEDMILQVPADAP